MATQPGLEPGTYGLTEKIKPCIRVLRHGYLAHADALQSEAYAEICAPDSQSVIEKAQSGWQDISTAPRDKTAIQRPLG